MGFLPSACHAACTESLTEAGAPSVGLHLGGSPHSLQLSLPEGYQTCNGADGGGQQRSFHRLQDLFQCCNNTGGSDSGKNSQIIISFGNEQ